MSNAGLLYVGAVLFINGLMYLGKIPRKLAAVMNFFVGGMQIILTVILAQANGDPAAVLGACGLCIFGLTIFLIFLTGTSPALILPAENYVRTAVDTTLLAILTTMDISGSFALSKRNRGPLPIAA